MPKYEIEFSKAALKSIKEIPKKYQINILQKIEDLANNVTEMPNVKKLVDFEVAYRLRVGDYRILFDKDDTIRIIAIIDVKHRKESYRRN